MSKFKYPGENPTSLIPKKDWEIKKKIIDRYKKFIFEEFYKYHYAHSMRYFIEQSESYPKWWTNFEWWGHRNNEDNPIYKHKFKDLKH